jgi:hypothetical protein
MKRAITGLPFQVFLVVRFLLVTCELLFAVFRRGFR